LAVTPNSELLPLPVVEPTVRRGDITQPFATINTLTSNNANFRMGESLSSVGPNNNESNTFGLSLEVRCLPGRRKQLVKS
jgi:hypothetical protein